ncbi:uncharacterized protein LOC143177998 [Calliopsis andreniformis]|uniref:uncharacterized protein LOC143177998 n=1 Tax=Calliopsis andreniformis TaxID=337506 RepID=UPI003FCDAE5D
MTVLRRLEWGCTRLGAIKRQNHKYPRLVGVPKVKKIDQEGAERTILYSKRKIAELLFENCADCKRMATIPQGAFAACKVRRNRELAALTMIEEKENIGAENVFNARLPMEGREPTPLKYNSKLMNSIWGLYNRYSVHNFKKNTDGDEGVFERFAAVSGALFQSHVPAASAMTAAAVTEKSMNHQ